MLYSLCEELTDEDLGILKEIVPDNLKYQILTAEDWFTWAYQKQIFSKTDFSQLLVLFSNYPQCLKIIHDFEGIFIFQLNIIT